MPGYIRPTHKTKAIEQQLILLLRKLLGELIPPVLSYVVCAEQHLQDFAVRGS